VVFAPGPLSAKKMNLEATLLTEGIRAEQSVSAWTFLGLTVTRLRTFPGTLNPQQGLDPRLNLGSDVRELCKLNVLRVDYPPGMEQEDRLAQLDDIGGTVATWRIVQREDNPGDPEVILWLVKVLPQVDS
jgi:hypothetical protein